MEDAKRVYARVTKARQDRARHALWMDEIIRLGLPTYRRVQSKTDSASQVSEQDDLFETTLQTTVEDFASDMISTFTPRHERWVRFAPAGDLTEGQRKEIAGQVQGVEDAIFAELERSNYWDAAQECFAFWSVAAMGVAVSDMGPLQPLHFQPIEIPDLILERGADGSLVGKWREMFMDQMDLWSRWSAVFPEPPKDQRLKKVAVVEGCDRDFSTPGVEQWAYRIFVDGKEKFAESYQGQGACPIIACRYRHQADSAWGPGPAHKATPIARTLDELAYLNLKALQRSVDPAFSYEEDGISNFEAGMQPGMGYPRATGSEPPENMLPDIRFDALVFNQEDMRKAIKRALYQDRPEQPGLTPPTATQWGDEKEWNTRRRELPRDRCVREWVLPIIERVAWIKARRGELPEVKLQGGRLINVQPVSPMSKAKDWEDVNLTNQVVGMAMQIGQAAQAGVPIDLKPTLENIIRTAKERHIVMKSDQQLAAEAAAAAMAQGGTDAAAPAANAA